VTLSPKGLKDGIIVIQAFRVFGDVDMRQSMRMPMVNIRKMLMAMR
jgi:hypothetical protein